MTLFDQKFRSKHRSLVNKSRREKLRCVKLEENLYYCARRAANHGRYLISLTATKTGLFATCRTTTGAACPSFGCCIHICKVHEALKAELNKRERKEVAA